MSIKYFETDRDQKVVLLVVGIIVLMAILYTLSGNMYLALTLAIIGIAIVLILAFTSKIPVRNDKEEHEEEDQFATVFKATIDPMVQLVAPSDQKDLRRWLMLDVGEIAHRDYRALKGIKTLLEFDKLCSTNFSDCEWISGFVFRFTLLNAALVCTGVSTPNKTTTPTKDTTKLFNLLVNTVSMKDIQGTQYSHDMNTIMNVLGVYASSSIQGRKKALSQIHNTLVKLNYNKRQLSKVTKDVDAITKAIESKKPFVKELMLLCGDIGNMHDLDLYSILKRVAGKDVVLKCPPPNKKSMLNDSDHSVHFVHTTPAAVTTGPHYKGLQDQQQRQRVLNHDMNQGLFLGTPNASQSSAFF